MKLTNAERRAKLQRFEVEDRIAWLKDHIDRFEQAEDSGIRTALLHAWRSELLRKRELQGKIADGKFVSSREIASHTDSAVVIKYAHARYRY
jgi:hypothetical protein